MLRQGGAFVVAQKIHNRRRRFIGVHSTAAAAASCVIAVALQVLLTPVTTPVRIFTARQHSLLCRALYSL